MELLNNVIRLLKSHFPYLTFSIQELEDVEKRGGHVLTFMNDDEVCAYLVLDTKIPKGEPCSPHKNCFYISYMGTRNKYRGQGLGRALVLEAKALAEKERRSIYTYVATFNIPELNLLYSEGFRAIKIVNMFKQDWTEMEYEV